MATITITVPDAVLQRVLDAFANVYGWTATIPDPAHPGSTIPNPQSEAAFAKAQIIAFAKNVVAQAEAPAAAETARTNAISNVNSTITLT